MAERFRSFLLIVAVFWLACAVGAPLWAQDASNEVVPLPRLAPPDIHVPQNPIPVPVPPGQPPADPPFEWTHSRTNGSTTGNASNMHQRYTSEDGKVYTHRHMVTNPSGQITRTRERTYDGDSHTLTRERNRAFRDGRTMEMTRTHSWDADSGTGTMSRTFEGPNGQSQSFERPWSPDGELADVQPPFGPDGLRPPEAPEQPDRGMHNLWGFLGSTKKSKSDGTFWGKLNMFRHGEKSMVGPKPSPGHSGFTLGSNAHRSVNAPRYGLVKKQAGQAEVRVRGPKPPSKPRLERRPMQSPSPPHSVKAP